jgi:Secretion system C-terminal sorting domain
MKIFIYIFLFALISIPNLYSQDYQTVNSGRIAYFNSSVKNIKSLRFDSVKFQNDSILFPFAVIQEINDYCFSPYNASWIGNKVIIKENGENIFFNQNYDSIYINTKANFGDKWIAFQIDDSLVIEATILKHDTLSFLTIVDSVKTIGFQVYDKSMNSIEFEINNMSILMSKHYGFVRTMNFYLFPNIYAEHPFDKFEEFNLIGLSKPEVGIQNLTWFKVNDFQVDDELHIIDKSSSWGNSYGYSITNKAIYRYLNRKNYPDSIVYIYSRKQSIETEYSDSSSFIFIYDTIKKRIEKDPYFDKLPEEPIIENEITYNYFMTNESPLSKMILTGLAFSGTPIDTCWYQIMFDGCLSDNKYLNGLGGPYYFCTNTFSLGETERKLVYYKKGDIIWGNPLSITGIEKFNISKYLCIYPNPASDQIQVHGAKQNITKLEIIDINGKTVLTLNEIIGNNIEISQLSKGLYFVNIYLASEVRIGKFVKY